MPAGGHSHITTDTSSQVHPPPRSSMSGSPLPSRPSELEQVNSSSSTVVPNDSPVGPTTEPSTLPLAYRKSFQQQLRQHGWQALLTWPEASLSALLSVGCHTIRAQSSYATVTPRMEVSTLRCAEKGPSFAEGTQQALPLYCQESRLDLQHHWKQCYMISLLSFLECWLPPDVLSSPSFVEASSKSNVIHRSHGSTRVESLCELHDKGQSGKGKNKGKGRGHQAWRVQQQQWHQQSSWSDQTQWPSTSDLTSQMARLLVRHELQLQSIQQDGHSGKHCKRRSRA